MVHTVAHTQCHTETDRHIRADIHTVPNEVFASACLSQRTSHFMRSRHIRPLLVACAGRDQSPQTHACRVCAVVHALQAPVASKPAHRQDGCTLTLRSPCSPCSCSARRSRRGSVQTARTMHRTRRTSSPPPPRRRAASTSRAAPWWPSWRKPQQRRQGMPHCLRKASPRWCGCTHEGSRSGRRKIRKSPGRTMRSSPASACRSRSGR